MTPSWTRPTNEELERFWKPFVERLRELTGRAHFDTWLARLKVLVPPGKPQLAGGERCLVARNPFTKDWIERHYLEQLARAADVCAEEPPVFALLLDRDLGDEVEFEPPSLGALGGPNDSAPPARVRRPLPPARAESGPARESEARGFRPFWVLRETPRASRSRGGLAEREGPAERVFEPVEVQAQAAGSAPTEPPTPLLGSAATAGDSVPAAAESGGPRSRAAVESVNSASLEFFQLHSDFVLNDNFTFQQFVVGSCNELACAAGKAVAEFPGGPYNPLFIYGGSGLGKTHLLQAICHAILRSATPRRILYLSCESFVNRFIQAVTDSKLAEFRYACRAVDILLVDDIQFLEGKNRTQEEFFHTFNTLYNGKKQIVLSSDRSPKEMPTLKDRLVSRFGWGMVTKLDSPCLETRVAIVKRKAGLRGFELSSEVAQFLAERIDTNIRELEGAVTKVLGYANLMGRRVDLGLVEEALADFLPRRREVSIQRVMELVAKEFGVQTRDLQSKTRVKSVVVPRQIAMFLARQHTALSLVQIGGFFGGRDHATVMHSIKKIKRRLEQEDDLSERIQELSNRLLRGE